MPVFLDVTLATQGTINRIRPFIETAKNWEGPIQVIIVTSE